MYNMCKTFFKISLDTMLVVYYLFLQTYLFNKIHRVKHGTILFFRICIIPIVSHEKQNQHKIKKKNKIKYRTRFYCSTAKCVLFNHLSINLTKKILNIYLSI